MATVRRTSPATAWSWVTITMVVPSSSLAVRNAAKTCSRCAESSSPVGSSASSTDGAVGERHGDGDALLLAAGHLVRAAVAAVGDLQQLQEFQRRVGAAARRGSAAARAAASGSATFWAAVR